MTERQAGTLTILCFFILVLLVVIGFFAEMAVLRFYDITECGNSIPACAVRTTPAGTTTTTARSG